MLPPIKDYLSSGSLVNSTINMLFDWYWFDLKKHCLMTPKPAYHENKVDICSKSRSFLEKVLGIIQNIGWHMLMSHNSSAVIVTNSSDIKVRHTNPY